MTVSADPSCAPPLGSAARYTSQFRELTDRVTAAGLMRRRYGFYWRAFGAAVAALAGTWTGIILLDDS